MSANDFRTCKGMSLVELMVSMSILSVVLLSMIYGMTVNMKLQYNSRVTDMAMADLLTVRDHILSVPFSELKKIYPDNSTIAGINRVAGEVVTITYPNVSGVGDDLYMVSATITWLDYGRRTHTRSLEFWKKK